MNRTRPVNQILALALATLFLVACSGESESASTQTDLRSDSSNWRYVSGSGYEGMAIPTERFPTSIGTTRIEGDPPTDEEIADFENRIVEEIVESGIEEVEDFENLTSELPNFKRYYFPGVNVVSERAFDPDAFSHLPEDTVLNPQLRPELDGERVIMVEFTRSPNQDWRTLYNVSEAAGYLVDLFYVLYLPDSGVFWIEFSLGGEIDNDYH